MIKLERYQLTNYKSINDQIKDLGLVNIFIGENGCGKSNLLESIKYGFEFLRSYNIIEREGEIFPSIFTYDSKGHKDTSLEFTVEIESSYLLPLLKAIYAGIEGDRSSIERIIEENPTLYLTLFYQYVIGSRGKEFINLHEISINRPHNEGYKSQLLRINVIGGNIHILKLPTLEQNLTGTTSHGTDSISRNDEKNFIKKEISNLLKTFSEKVLYITKNESFRKFR